MSKERLYLFDTTLRDGAQTTGVDFSVEDKRRIAAVLDELGVDYVEGGFPGANATDTQFLGEPSQLTSAKLTAFGMTKRSGRSVSNDPGLQAVLGSRADAICLVTKSWDYHVRVALGITNEENLQALEQSVRAIVETGREAMIDCEHFFDGYKGNRTTRFLSCVRLTRPGRAGSCCATRTAARCRTRSSASSARWQSSCPARIWASTPTTTPRMPSPTR